MELSCSTWTPLISSGSPRVLRQGGESGQGGKVRRRFVMHIQKYLHINTLGTKFTAILAITRDYHATFPVFDMISKRGFLLSFLLYYISSMQWINLAKPNHSFWWKPNEVLQCSTCSLQRGRNSFPDCSNMIRFRRFARQSSTSSRRSRPRWGFLYHFFEACQPSGAVH